MPYVIWFRGQYELGLDFVFLTIIIPMVVCEVVVNRLMAYWNRIKNLFGQRKSQNG